jgi:hypothetical protein
METQVMPRPATGRVDADLEAFYDEEQDPRMGFDASMMRKSRQIRPPGTIPLCSVKCKLHKCALCKPEQRFTTSTTDDWMLHRRAYDQLVATALACGMTGPPTIDLCASIDGSNS